jgi:NAD(P)H-quinone oxidoreductase subunit K
MKMAPSLVRLYEQMPEPKYVIAMGACTITGGMFSTDSYTTVRGVDKLIPVDIYLPGCPPKPEAIIDAIIKLRKRIAQEIYNDRRRVRQGERYFTINHQFDFLLLTKNMKKSDKNFSNPFFQFEKTSSELKLGLKKIEKKSEVFFSSSKKGMI